MFRLRIQAGPRAGQSLSLTPGKTYIVGRAKETDLPFPEDATMSRAHAEFASDASGAWLLRNKSQHGTLVGAAKIDTERKLVPGDVLTIGGTLVVFEADPTGGAGSPDMATRPPGAAVPPPAGGEPRTPPPMPRPIGAATPAAAPGGAVPVTIAASAGAGKPGDPAKPGTPAAGGKPGDPAAAAAASLKKGGNKGIIIGVVVAVLLLCCCCPGSWYAFRSFQAYRAAHSGG